MSKIIEEAEIRQYEELQDFLRNGHGEYRELSTNTDNSAVIPEMVSEAIIQKATEKSPILSAVKVFRTNQGTLRVPIETDNSGGAFFGEGEAVTAQKFQLDSIDLKKKRLAAAAGMTKNIIYSAKIDLVNFVADKLSRQLADRLEESVFVGAGDDVSVHGILNNTEIASISGTGEPTVDEIANMITALKSKYRSNAAFYVSDEYFKKLIAWVDNAGRPMLETNVFNGKIVHTLFSYPVYSTSTLTTENPIVFGDVSNGYGLLVNEQSTIKRVTNSTSEALKGSELIVADYYVDGNCFNSEAIVRMTVSATS